MKNLFDIQVKNSENDLKKIKSLTEQNQQLKLEIEQLKQREVLLGEAGRNAQEFTLRNSEFNLVDRPNLNFDPLNPQKTAPTDVPTNYLRSTLCENDSDMLSPGRRIPNLKEKQTPQNRNLRPQSDDERQKKFQEIYDSVREMIGSMNKKYVDIVRKSQLRHKQEIENFKAKIQELENTSQGLKHDHESQTLSLQTELDEIKDQKSKLLKEYHEFMKQYLYEVQLIKDEKEDLQKQLKVIHELLFEKNQQINDLMLKLKLRYSESQNSTQNISSQKRLDVTTDHSIQEFCQPVENQTFYHPVSHQDSIKPIEEEYADKHPTKSSLVSFAINSDQINNFEEENSDVFNMGILEKIGYQ